MPTRNAPHRAATTGMALLAAACLAACSPPQASPAQAAPRVAQSEPVANDADLSRPQTACWLLPADTVSKVLAESLTTSADLGAIKYGNTSCDYYPSGSDPDEDAPRLTVTLDWNGYNIVAMQIPKAVPATAAAPYADIGDGALFKQGVLWIRGQTLRRHRPARQGRPARDCSATDGRGKAEACEMRHSAQRPLYAEADERQIVRSAGSLIHVTRQGEMKR